MMATRAPTIRVEYMELHENEAKYATALQIIRNSFLDPNYQSSWQVQSLKTVKNYRLYQNYQAKAREFRALERDTSEHDMFTCYKTMDLIRNILENGLTTRQSSFNFLGDSRQGVNLCKHADIQLKAAENTGQEVCYLIMYKVMLGKALPVLPSPDNQQLAPIPGYDSHISNVVVNHTSALGQQAIRSQVFCYEYTNGELSSCPRQVLPYVVVCYNRGRTAVVPDAPAVSPLTLPIQHPNATIRTQLQPPPPPLVQMAPAPVLRQPNIYHSKNDTRSNQSQAMPFQPRLPPRNPFVQPNVPVRPPIRTDQSVGHVARPGISQSIDHNRQILLPPSSLSRPSFGTTHNTSILSAQQPGRTGMRLPYVTPSMESSQHFSSNALHMNGVVQPEQNFASSAISNNFDRFTNAPRMTLPVTTAATGMTIPLQMPPNVEVAGPSARTESNTGIGMRLPIVIQPEEPVLHDNPNLVHMPNNHESHMRLPTIVSATAVNMQPIIDGNMTLNHPSATAIIPTSEVASQAGTLRLDIKQEPASRKKKPIVMGPIIIDEEEDIEDIATLQPNNAELPRGESVLPAANEVPTAADLSIRKQSNDYETPNDAGPSLSPEPTTEDELVIDDQDGITTQNVTDTEDNLKNGQNIGITAEKNISSGGTEGQSRSEYTHPKENTTANENADSTSLLPPVGYHNDLDSDDDNDTLPDLPFSLEPRRHSVESVASGNEVFSDPCAPLDRNGTKVSGIFTMSDNADLQEHKRLETLNTETESNAKDKARKKRKRVNSPWLKTKPKKRKLNRKDKVIKSSKSSKMQKTPQREVLQENIAYRICEDGSLEVFLDIYNKPGDETITRDQCLNKVGPARTLIELDKKRPALQDIFDDLADELGPTEILVAADHQVETQAQSCQTLPNDVSEQDIEVRETDDKGSTFGKNGASADHEVNLESRLTSTPKLGDEEKQDQIIGSNSNVDEPLWKKAELDKNYQPKVLLENCDSVMKLKITCVQSLICEDKSKCLPEKEKPLKPTGVASSKSPKSDCNEEPKREDPATIISRKLKLHQPGSQAYHENGTNGDEDFTDVDKSPDDQTNCLGNEDKDQSFTMKEVENNEHEPVEDFHSGTNAAVSDGDHGVALDGQDLDRLLVEQEKLQKSIEELDSDKPCSDKSDGEDADVDFSNLEKLETNASILRALDEEDNTDKKRRVLQRLSDVQKELNEDKPASTLKRKKSPLDIILNSSESDDASEKKSRKKHKRSHEACSEFKQNGKNGEFSDSDEDDITKGDGTSKNGKTSFEKPGTSKRGKSSDVPTQTLSNGEEPYSSRIGGSPRSHKPELQENTKKQRKKRPKKRKKNSKQQKKLQESQQHDTSQQESPEDQSVSKKRVSSDKQECGTGHETVERSKAARPEDSGRKNDQKGVEKTESAPPNAEKWIETCERIYMGDGAKKQEDTLFDGYSETSKPRQNPKEWLDKLIRLNQKSKSDSSDRDEGNDKPSKELKPTCREGTDLLDTPAVTADTHTNDQQNITSSVYVTNPKYPSMPPGMKIKRTSSTNRSGAETKSRNEHKPIGLTAQSKNLTKEEVIELASKALTIFKVTDPGNVVNEKDTQYSTAGNSQTTCVASSTWKEKTTLHQNKNPKYESSQSGNVQYPGPKKCPATQHRQATDWYNSSVGEKSTGPSHGSFPSWNKKNTVHQNANTVYHPSTPRNDTITEAMTPLNIKAVKSNEIGMMPFVSGTAEKTRRTSAVDNSHYHGVKNQQRSPGYSPRERRDSSSSTGENVMLSPRDAFSPLTSTSANITNCNRDPRHSPIRSTNRDRDLRCLHGSTNSTTVPHGDRDPRLRRSISEDLVPDAATAIEKYMGEEPRDKTNKLWKASLYAPQRPGKLTNKNRLSRDKPCSVIGRNMGDRDTAWDYVPYDIELPHGTCYKKMENYGKDSNDPRLRPRQITLGGNEEYVERLVTKDTYLIPLECSSIPQIVGKPKSPLADTSPRNQILKDGKECRSDARRKSTGIEHASDVKPCNIDEDSASTQTRVLKKDERSDETSSRSKGHKAGAIWTSLLEKGRHRDGFFNVDVGGCQEVVRKLMEEVWNLDNAEWTTLKTEMENTMSVHTQKIDDSMLFNDPTRGLNPDKRKKLMRSEFINNRVAKELQIENDMHYLYENINQLREEMEKLQRTRGPEAKIKIYRSKIRTMDIRYEKYFKDLEELNRFYKSSVVEVLPDLLRLPEEKQKFISVEGNMLIMASKIKEHDCKHLFALREEILYQQSLLDKGDVMYLDRQQARLRLGWLHGERKEALCRLCVNMLPNKEQIVQKFSSKIAWCREGESALEEDGTEDESLLSYIKQRITNLDIYLNVLQRVQRNPVNGVWSYQRGSVKDKPDSRSRLSKMYSEPKPPAREKDVSAIDTAYGPGQHGVSGLPPMKTNKDVPGSNTAHVKGQQSGSNHPPFTTAFIKPFSVEGFGSHLEIPGLGASDENLFANSASKVASRSSIEKKESAASNANPNSDLIMSSSRGNELTYEEGKRMEHSNNPDSDEESALVMDIPDENVALQSVERNENNALDAEEQKTLSDEKATTNQVNLRSDQTGVSCSNDDKKSGHLSVDPKENSKPSPEPHHSSADLVEGGEHSKHGTYCLQTKDHNKNDLQYSNNVLVSQSHTESPSRIDSKYSSEDVCADVDYNKKDTSIQGYCYFANPKTDDVSSIQENKFENGSSSKTHNEMEVSSQDKSQVQKNPDHTNEDTPDRRDPASNVVDEARQSAPCKPTETESSTDSADKSNLWATSFMKNFKDSYKSELSKMTVDSEQATHHNTDENVVENQQIPPKDARGSSDMDISDSSDYEGGTNITVGGPLNKKIVEPSIFDTPRDQNMCQSGSTSSSGFGNDTQNVANSLQNIPLPPDPLSLRKSRWDVKPGDLSAPGEPDDHDQQPDVTEKRTIKVDNSPWRLELKPNLNNPSKTGTESCVFSSMKDYFPQGEATNIERVLTNERIVTLLPKGQTSTDPQEYRSSSIESDWSSSPSNKPESQRSGSHSPLPKSHHRAKAQKWKGQSRGKPNKKSQGYRNFQESLRTLDYRDISVNDPTIRRILAEDPDLIAMLSNPLEARRLASMLPNFQDRDTVFKLAKELQGNTPESS